MAGAPPPEAPPPPLAGAPPLAPLVPPAGAPEEPEPALAPPDPACAVMGLPVFASLLHAAAKPTTETAPSNHFDWTIVFASPAGKKPHAPHTFSSQLGPIP